ncbi:General substrate transporter [Niveomyces insectorum RCEF 264]|uniref:General substrate transporter n=1 Tax=Niveomyces insectorum RCEF 264 TaxID=1081102 RepID=A0A167Y016_9HYPO|nr:General substrate transporter [Niveomyces insectorum RCEF 264]
MAPKTSFGHLRNNTKPQWWNDPCLRRNVLQCIGLYFAVFYLGYDGALLSCLQELPTWNNYFNSPSGSYLGVISACLFLPAIVSPYAADFINSRWGRKPTLVVASVLLFMGGRVLMGAAGAMGKMTSAVLLQEIAHPRLRPILTTSYFCNYYFGSIAAAWFCYGTLGWGDTNNWQWRAPCLFQIMAPTVTLFFLIFLIPESPRWLVDHDRGEEALDMLAKNHANGDKNDELVKWEYEEICIALEDEKLNSQTRYVDFLKTSGNRRRLYVILTVASGGNWVGNGVITYYLTPILKLVGIGDTRTIAQINGGLAIWNLIFAYLGSTNSERVGRRPLWLISTGGMVASITVITALSGSFAQTGHSGVGLAVVPFLFIFYGFYDIGWTPLAWSYSAEILPYHMRVKGIGLQLSITSILQAFNQWVNPVALSAIGWKYYIVYVALDVMYFIIIFFIFPETKSLTIEEVSILFDHGRQGDVAAAREAFEQRHTGDMSKAVDNDVAEVEVQNIE